MTYAPGPDGLLLVLVLGEQHPRCGRVVTRRPALAPEDDPDVVEMLEELCLVFREHVHGVIRAHLGRSPPSKQAS